MERIRKILKFISPNSRIIFLIISIFSLVNGPCLNGCLALENLPGKEWLVPISNAVSRILNSLYLSIPLVFVISLTDFFIKPKLRAILLSALTIGSIAAGVYWSVVAEELEGLAAVGFLLFTLTVLVPLTFMNWIQARKI